MNLIQYVASYGDLLTSAEPEAKYSSSAQRTKVSCDTKMSQHYTLPEGSYIISLNVSFVSLSFPVCPHLRLRHLPRLSSRCCKI